MFKDFVNNDQFEAGARRRSQLERHRTPKSRDGDSGEGRNLHDEAGVSGALGSADAARMALPQHPWFRKRIQRDFDSNFENSSWNRSDGAACLVLMS